MDLTGLVDVLQVLSDPIRLRIVHLLWARQDRDWSVNQLVIALDLPQPTVSRHLAILREHSLIQRERDGRFRRYRLADVQHRLHAAILAALEPFVVQSAEAQLDLERADEFELPAPTKHVTKELPIEADEEMRRVFKALGNTTRRRILDRVAAAQGCTLGTLADGFDTSRAAIARHVDTLEDAGLIHSRREGRERRLFADAVPLHLMVDRWTTPLTARLAAHVVTLKNRIEGENRDG